MNKKIIGLLITSTLSINAYATQQQNDIDVLNSVLLQLQGNKDTENKTQQEASKVIVEDIKNSQEPKTLNNNDNKSNINVVDNNVLTQNFGQQQYIKQEESKQEVVSTERAQPSHNVTNQINNLAVQDVVDSKTDLELRNEQLFLVNVPIESKLTATIDIQIPPYRDKLFYEQGKIVSDYPFNLNSKATFCYLVLETSGMWRRFKADPSKVLKITSNVTEKQKFQEKNNVNNFIEVYKTTITFDNKHIKNLVCETSEKTLPLTIKDLNLATGNLFKFEFTPIQDI